MRRPDGPEILFIDDVDIFGFDASSFVRELALTARQPLIVLGLRSARADRLADPIVTSGLPLKEVVMPPLTDEDIDDLIAVLDRENRLRRTHGQIAEQRRGMFRRQCGRQLLVAMLSATLGERFEERILDEASGLEQAANTIYLLTAVATALRHYLTRDELLLALGDTSNATLNTLEALVKRHLIVPVSGGLGLALRHRLVAEVVFENVLKDRTAAALIGKLIFVQSSKVTSGLSRSARPWRFLRTLSNHEFLLRTVGVEEARAIYANVECLLHWDYHYWLQRGSLEVERGDIRLAQRFLGAASDGQRRDGPHGVRLSSNSFGRRHPTSLEAPARVDEGMNLLYEIIANRGNIDQYPYHIRGVKVSLGHGEGQ